MCRKLRHIGNTVLLAPIRQKRLTTRYQPADGGKPGAGRMKQPLSGWDFHPLKIRAYSRRIGCRPLVLPTYGPIVLATRKPTFSEELGSMKSRNQT